MDIQTERLDDHSARFTVEVDETQLEEAKKKAAKQLSRQVNIPGFRRGKAPYKIVVNRLGEATVLEEAIEVLGNDIYKKALDDSSLDPYAPGTLEEFKIDPPTFIFTVPLQPEVELGAYRDIRQDFEVPEVTDEDLEQTMKRLQDQEALVEESPNPAKMDDRVTIDIHSEFVDGEDPDEGDDDESEPEEVEASQADDDEQESIDDVEVPKKGDPFIHYHDLPLTLNETDEPLPGFAAALVGAEADSDVEFELDVPDNEEFKDIVGRKVKFTVVVKKVELVTLPALNDDFAARVTQNEDEPLTLLQLRIRMRENLEAETKEQAEEAYAQQILDLIDEQATVAFPQIMVDARVEEMLGDLDTRMKQQGITLDDYIKVSDTSREELGQQYQESAAEGVRRSLVLQELLQAENVQVDETQIDEVLSALVNPLAMQSDDLMKRLNSPEMRGNVLSRLLYQEVLNRIVKIGQGLDPDAPDDADEIVEVAASSSADTENDSADEPETTSDEDQPAENLEEAEVEPE